MVLNDESWPEDTDPQGTSHRGNHADFQVEYGANPPWYGARYRFDRGVAGAAIPI